MDFGQLEAFVQVAAHRSFSRAAEALRLTQPSITARIQSLERELGEAAVRRGGWRLACQARLLDSDVEVLKRGVLPPEDGQV